MILGGCVLSNLKIKITSPRYTRVASAFQNQFLNEVKLAPRTRLVLPPINFAHQAAGVVDIEATKPHESPHPRQIFAYIHCQQREI